MKSLKEVPDFKRLWLFFWRNPDLLMAAKATIVMAVVVVPLEILGLSFFAVSLALGILAGALSETDDHPRGRIKSLTLKVVSFGVASLSVELLRPWPVWLGIGLGFSTIVFILAGGAGERYRGVTFGAILVGIYTMIGAEISPAWYWQPLLLAGGALIYGVVSLFLLYLRPYRLLDEQLGRGYIALARYLDEKSRLFPSDEQMQGDIRSKLALLNVEVVTSLERIKEVLNSYRDAMKDDRALGPWFHYFMVLQELHERAASSHERYELLSNDKKRRDIVEISGQVLHELSRAALRFSKSLLTGVPYEHPVSLKWIVASLTHQLEAHNLESIHPLRLLVTNLVRANASFQRLSIVPEEAMLPRLSHDQRSFRSKFKDQLNFEHPRMRYAIRLALSFCLGYAISEMFNVDKGEWIVLTILFVLQPTYSATRRRLFQRVLGTLTGVVVGVLVVKLLTLPGQVLLMLLSAYFFFAWLKREYSFSVAFITIFVLCAFNLVSSEGVALMFPRLTDTLIGAFLALGVVRLLWPQWQYKKLPGLLFNALEKNTNYFRVILDEYKGLSSEDDLQYRIARREAHQADNALALAWQDVQSEPRKYRKFRQQAYNLTYLNHALLSFISAFGAHREKSDQSGTELFALGNEILGVFGNNEIDKHQKKEGFTSIINQIHEQLQKEEPLPYRQQFILLYNIAVTGRQLLDRSYFISK